MGREIRKVPKGWEHPVDQQGEYRPMFDRDYEDAARKWLDKVIAWDNGSDPDCAKYKAVNPFYWDWDGGPPDKEYHRPKWTEEPSCFQVYETVSEGTPTSPVFENLDQMVQWLIGEGYSAENAQSFIKAGHAPSLTITANGIGENIHGLGL